MRNIALLGSTGSVGCNALELIEKNREKFRLVSIAAGENVELLKKQIKEFEPEIISVKNKKDCSELKTLFPHTKIFYGNQGLMEVVQDERVDTVISAIDGTAGLEATLQSIKNNHRICLANKEVLVAAGELVNRELEGSKAELIPIDSEQSAIFQSLGLNQKDFVRRIILTASGGPFFRKKKDDFLGITVKEALSHPTWSMGTKITIDSATLMNKALEIIESYFLFNLRSDQIGVVIHPQSIIHSMVEFIDSSIIAQLSFPDMKIPILYSLSYPERIVFNEKYLNFSDLKKLEFYDVDQEKFGSIKMAYYVLENQKNAGAVFNAANETAVEHFLRGEITFIDIFTVVGSILYKEKFQAINSVEDILETIERTKDNTENYIKRRKNK